MAVHREESKRSRKKSTLERGVSWKPIARASVLIIIFSVASIAFAKLLSLLPDSGKLSPLVTLGLPLALAWLVAAGIGTNMVSKRYAFAIATICLLVAAPLAHFKPWERAGESEGWTPGQTTPPENVPENMVAFHFLASFTYDGSEGDPALSGFAVDLPMPHVAGYAPVGIPEDKWDFVIPVLNGWTRDRPSIWDTGFEELESNSASAILWVRYAIYRGNELRWERRLENGLVSVTSAGPSRTVNFSVEDRWKEENIMPKASIEMGEGVEGVYTPRDSLYPGETLLLEGVFFVHEDNAARVRIGDLGPISGSQYYTPEKENTPVVSVDWGGPILIKADYIVQLEKLVDETWGIVEKFRKIVENDYPGWTYIQRA